MDQYLREMNSFRKFATKKDVEIIESNKIARKDYVRLHYILYRLEFYALLEKISDKCIDEPDIEAFIYKDTETIEKWLADFLSEVSDKFYRSWIIKKFSV